MYIDIDTYIFIYLCIYVGRWVQGIRPVRLPESLSDLSPVHVGLKVLCVPK